MEFGANVPPHYDPLRSPGAHHILIVDDDPLSAIAVSGVLTDAGYFVNEANDVDIALTMIAVAPPDLIVLDVTMPKMDGFTFCRQIKADEKTKDIPILFMTAREGIHDFVKAFESGGEDYVTKPFRREELVARVTTHVRLHDAFVALDRLRLQALDANALTHLPGNTTIDATIQKALDQGSEIMVIYADLDNFKAFNDRYGFSKGDSLLRFTSDVLCRCTKIIPESFVGNIGGDDFVLLVPIEEANKISQSIMNAFDAGVKSYYESDDVAHGGIQTVNRKGESEFFPIASISMAGVPLHKGRYSRVAEVSTVCAEIKKVAKKVSGSSFVIDQRGKFA